MTCSHGIAAGLVLCLAALAWCDEPAPPLLTVEEWIEQLGNRDFKMREKAAKAIEAAGIDALPALRKARMHKDPEIRKRVEAWLPGLERAVLLSPKLVT